MQESELKNGHQPPRVFEDVRVLDFTAVIAGSYCTRMLADLGAEVIKIENFAGEVVRYAGPMRGEVSALFSALNSGKRSLTLDLKNSTAIDICKQLVKTYDVVVENYSPGVMHKLGLNYKELKAVNPKLIMCSISGYGQTGPDANRPAYAPIVQATSGFETAYLRSQGNQGKPLNMGLPIGDTAAAQQAFGAISAALYYRALHRIGQYIDISMQDTLLATMHKDFQTSALGEMNDRHYGPLETLDGHLIVVPLNQHHFQSTVECIERVDLLEDPRFATVRSRIYNYDYLQEIMETWTKKQSTEDAFREFDQRGVPCARYRGLSELKNDPQLTHRGMLAEVVDAAGPLQVANTAFQFSDTAAAVGREVPLLGQHSRDTLSRALKMTSEQISQLIKTGVVGPEPN